MNSVRNKYLYKILLTLIKYIPTILAISKIIGLILNSLKITSFSLTCCFGTSFTFLILMYLLSFIFRFCGTHRISLNYVTCIYILTIIDYYIGIPISNPNVLRLYAIISGLFIITWIYVWYKNRNNPKIDHIKRLCETYTDCGC